MNDKEKIGRKNCQSIEHTHKTILFKRKKRTLKLGKEMDLFCCIISNHSNHIKQTKKGVLPQYLKKI